MGQGSEDRAQGGAVAAPRRVGRDLSCHKARHTAPGAPGLSLSGALLRFLMIGHGGRIHTAIDRGGNVSALTMAGPWRGRCDQRGGLCLCAKHKHPARGLMLCTLAGASVRGAYAVVVSAVGSVAPTGKAGALAPSMVRRVSA